MGLARRAQYTLIPPAIKAIQLTRGFLIRLAVAAATGFVFAAATLAMVLDTGAVPGTGVPTVMTGYGWIVPLLAAVVAGSVGWLLIRDNRSGTPSYDGSVRESVCPLCGESVRVDWRLCPHCGDRITGR